MKPTKPISPEEIVNLKTSTIPDFVIAAFNKCIAQNWEGSYSIFTQDEVIAEILSGREPLTRQVIFKKNWLDVELIYMDAGWWVQYDKPGYNETYKATFEFRKTR